MGCCGRSASSASAAPTDQQVETAVAALLPAALPPALESTMPTVMEQALEDYTPGARIARVTSAATINITSAAYPGASLAGMTFPIVGNGREVTVEFYAPNIYHSVVGANITVMLIVDSYLNGDGQLATFTSTRTTGGQPGFITTSFLIPDGVTKTIAVSAYADVAGTTTFSAAAFAKIELKATRA